jgi:16S rRNA (cytidine1402-2'-O)-methyltransferase
MAATLHLIATPLGNLGDLSLRARETLSTVDLLYAEDTRSAQRMLGALGIGRPCRSCFDANEHVRAAEIVAHLGAGRSVGLVSEAGTPAFSDPGFKVVRAAIEAGARVTAVPGPSAAITALVCSGLPTDRAYFGGFLPRKPGPRRESLHAVQALEATLVFFESPQRAAATLADAADILGKDRPACLARELTKTHEEFVRGTLAELALRYAEQRPLGEVTLVIAGAAARTPEEADQSDIARRARRLLDAGLSARDVAAALAAELDRPRREMYQLVLHAGGTAPDDSAD